MRIAIDIAPIDSSSSSNHKVRGVGKYITLLKDNLQKFDNKNTYIFTSHPGNEKDIDLIHYPYFDPFFLTLPIFKRVKSLVTVHDLIPLTHKKQFPVGVKGEIKWALNKSRLKKIDGILTDSYASKNAIKNVTGISDKKIFPVHLAVDQEFKKLKDGDWRGEVKKKYNLPDKFILYVGDVTWNKNLPNIVRAIKKVEVPLVMIGKAISEELFEFGNPWNKSRKEVLDETYDNPLFLKLGFVSQDYLISIYNLSKALVMPSYDEGFGLPVLEAMQSGCPVITSNCGSLAEVAGDAAIYVDPENVESISKGIFEILESDALRDSLIKKGTLQSQKFTLEKMMKDTISVYQAINNEKKN